MEVLSDLMGGHRRPVEPGPARDGVDPEPIVDLLVRKQKEAAQAEADAFWRDIVPRKGES